LFHNFNRILAAVDRGGIKTLAKTNSQLPTSAKKLAKVAGEFLNPFMNSKSLLTQTVQPKLKRCGNLQKKNNIMKKRCLKRLF
jgi:hypothetical protein